MSFFDKIGDKYRSSDTLTRLIMLNCAMFALVLLTDIILTLFTKSTLTAATIFQYQQDPGNLIFRPWTLVTAPLTSWGLWHLLFNMLTLYWLGGLFLRRSTSAGMRGLYILGALAAMVCFTATNFAPFLRTAQGTMPLASASILAIGTALAFQAPDSTEKLPLLGYVKIKWIVIALGLADVALLPHPSAAMDLAHAGAAAMGWYYQYRLRQGSDITAPLNRLYVKFSDLIGKMIK